MTTIPGGAPVYEALRNNFSSWKDAKFFDKQSFSNAYVYRKWLWDFYYTSAAPTGDISLPELIVKGICACMCAYAVSVRRYIEPFGIKYALASPYITDVTYSPSNIQDMWQLYCTEYEVAEGTKELISYGSFKLLGAHVHSAQLILDLSKIICSFNEIILYSPIKERFITWYL